VPDQRQHQLQGRAHLPHARAAALQSEQDIGEQGREVVLLGKRGPGGRLAAGAPM